MSDIGIIGGGQLARMLALAAHRLDLSVTVLDPDPRCPASDVATQIVGETHDVERLQRLAERSRVVTFESENIDVDAVVTIADATTLAPTIASLEVGSDRLREKLFFRALDIPTPTFAAAKTAAQLRIALERVGLPAVVKTRRFGYDGKGQHVVRNRGQADSVVAGSGGADLIVEACVPFTRELSVVLVRARNGAILAYPVVENEHREGILRVSIAPATELDDDLRTRAVAYASRIANALDYVGVLALEMFEVDGHLLANEMAPRVHNSGHWTLDGAETSQFENHVRAIWGLPLGGTDAYGPRAMVNLVGHQPSREALLAVPGVSAHLYGKQARPGRKLGHVNVGGADLAELRARIEAVRAIVDLGSVPAPGALAWRA